MLNRLHKNYLIVWKSNAYDLWTLKKADMWGGQSFFLFRFWGERENHVGIHIAVASGRQKSDRRVVGGDYKREVVGRRVVGAEDVDDWRRWQNDVGSVGKGVGERINVQSAESIDSPVGAEIDFAIRVYDWEDFVERGVD